LAGFLRLIAEHTFITLPSRIYNVLLGIKDEKV
jgi:hypothetical protein